MLKYLPSYDSLFVSILRNMQTEASADQLKQGGNLFQDVMKKLDKNRVVVVEAKDVVKLPPPSTVAAAGGDSLGPITPDSNRESGDSLFHLTSPLTMVSLPLKEVCIDSHQSNDPYPPNEGGPHTPEEHVFDPFAPGPEKLMLAPHCRKYLEESRTNVTRQLNFDSSIQFAGDGNSKSDPETASDEEMLLETIYGSLLEAIVTKQTEGFLTEISPQDAGSDGFKTPTSAPHLHGVAETCPGAPVKPTRKLRNIDQSLCRKLEF